MLIRISQTRGVYLPVKEILSLNKVREFYWVAKWLVLKETDKVLDIGCGSGFWTRRLARGCAFIVGVDLQPSNIYQREKNHRERCHFAAAGAEALPFADESFDKVVSICALEHFTSDRAAISEMNRVLKERGLLVMTVDSLTNPSVDDSYRQFHQKKYLVNNYYDVGKIRRRLEDGGFELLGFRFIINSKASFSLVRFFHGNPRTRAILVPILFPIALAADSFSGDQHSGMILAVRARKK